MFGCCIPSVLFTLYTLSNFFINFNGVSALQYSTVVIQHNGVTICSGTLKNTETVITAASCVDQGDIPEYAVFLDAALQYNVEIETVTIHNEYKRDRNNIALLHLTAPAEKDNKTVRIKGRLPTHVYDDKVVTKHPRCVLLDPVNDKKIDVEILFNSMCSRTLDQFIFDDQVCVFRPKGERENCPIGVGNPVVCKIDTGKWVQVAIHQDNGCSSNTMVATRLSKFRSWMRTAPLDQDAAIINVQNQLNSLEIVDQENVDIKGDKDVAVEKVGMTDTDTTNTQDPLRPKQVNNTNITNSHEHLEADTTNTTDIQESTEKENTNSTDTQEPTEVENTNSTDTQEPTEVVNTNSTDIQESTEEENTNSTDTQEPTEVENTNSTDTIGPTEVINTNSTDTQEPKEVVNTNTTDTREPLESKEVNNTSTTDTQTPTEVDNGNTTDIREPIEPIETPDLNQIETSKRPCNDSEFRCGDGTCISGSNVCDGRKDCPCGMEDESSCGCNLAGTEFITGFLNNVGPEVSILYISATEVTRVNVYIPFLSYNETREITGAEKWDISDTSLIITEPNSNKGVFVKSDKPITVIAVNSRESSYSTVDGTIVYPVGCLSREYLVEVQNHRFYKTSQYAIIGATDTPADVTIVNKRGRVTTARLGFLDTFFQQAKDLRGLSIEATENVVVLSGSECGYVPSGMTASCDHLVNQIPPRSMYHKAYIVAQEKPRTGFSFRVKATEDNTTVVLRDAGGVLVETQVLDIKTEYVKTYLDSQPLSVKANKGVMVTQYALDGKIDDLGQGDPSMIVLPSLNSFDTVYKFVIPDHFLRVSLTIYISSCYDINGLRLNGEEMSIFETSAVNVLGYGEYTVFNFELGSKWGSYSHAILSHIERDVTFGAYMYGTRVEGAFAWRIGGRL